MRKKLALFDLDGTLYDTRMVNYLSYKRALGDLGERLDYGFFAKHCNGKHYTMFLPEILGRDGIESMEEVHRRKKRIYPEFLSEARENQHLFQIMQCMKRDYYIGLVTSASRKNCEDILRYYHRLGDFDLIISQEDVERKKPDPEGFRMAMERFGIPKEDTVIFEDSETGIQAADQSGATVFVVRGFA